MNRTTATCIAGMRSKTATGIKTHFQRPKKPREAKPFTRVRPRETESFTRFTRRFLAFGLGIFAKRLRWRPSATRRDVALPRIANLEPREAKPFYADSSCASTANPSSSSDHLENGLQHADDCAVRAVHAFVKPAQAVEVTEQLVATLDEVNDHYITENVRKFAAEQKISEAEALQTGLQQKAKAFKEAGAEVYAK